MFEVYSRDKIDTFRAGCPGVPGNRLLTRDEAMKVLLHMEKQGYIIVGGLLQDLKRGEVVAIHTRVIEAR